MRQPRILHPVHPRVQGVPIQWRYPITILLVPFASKAAAAVGLPTYVKDTPAVQCRGTQQWRSPISGYGFENRVNELPTRRLPCLGAGDEEVRHRSERHGGVLGARRP